MPWKLKKKNIIIIKPDETAKNRGGFGGRIHEVYNLLL